MAEWTQEKIQHLIDTKAEESTYMDFKSASSLGKEDSRKKEICKDVSAFANSDGGVLIYGINEIDHKADTLSFVDGNTFTKEWLEQVITSGIHRRIDGIQITPIRFDDDFNKTVYVIDIPVSPLAPHMTKEGKYYKRFNFLSVAMEEYEVRFTYERKHRVLLDFADVSIELINGDSWLEDRKFKFLMTFHIQNNGQSMAEKYKLRVTVDGAEDCEFSYPTDVGYNLVKPGKGRVVLSSTKSFPIFPDEIISIMEMTLVIPFGKTDIAKKSLQLSQTLFTETEQLHDLFKPGKLIDTLIGRVTGFPSEEDEGKADS